VPADQFLEGGVRDVLRGLTREDARDAYEAIRRAQPGGLGTADRQDAAREPTVTLREAMQLAADRDTIAAQYANDFDLVLRVGVSHLAQAAGFSQDWETTIVGLHLRLMADCPDTLIARKCGNETAIESARRARQVLDVGWPHGSLGMQEIANLDAWLRADGHRRNPGTTADLVAASLFAALREGKIVAPRLQGTLP
jgi:triphosphoribosyl-dephospho-CoA synthase